MIFRTDSIDRWAYTTICFLLMLLAGFQPRQAFACSCAGPVTPDEAFNITSSIFEGKVTKTDRGTGIGAANFALAMLWDIPIIGPWIESRSGSMILAGQTKMQVDVLRSWKGVETKQVTVYTGMGGGDCGMPLSPGDHYLFYAHEWQENLSIGICNRTQRMSSASEDMQFLAGKSTLTLSSVPGSGVPAWIWPAILASVLVILFKRK